VQDFATIRSTSIRSIRSSGDDLKLTFILFGMGGYITNQGFFLLSYAVNWLDDQNFHQPNSAK
jgi:hypothetical protein